MKIYITLDYELFFGPKSGSVEKCIIEPTERLLQIVNPYGIKFICFVDSGYLIALEKQMKEYPELEQDYRKITNQIKKLSHEGHGIELHIHPHWEDSYFNGDSWCFDTSRYKLHNFGKNEVFEIVTKHTEILTKISGKKPVAYRGGGWSVQPFDHIKEALEHNQVFIDSTVYPGGIYRSESQWFDFSSVPQYKTQYSFSNDITKEDETGEFTEIPISSITVSPFFYWKFVLLKILKLNRHKTMGNGSAIPMEQKYILKLLFNPSSSVASIDGYKASLISSVFQKYKLNTLDEGNFVLIGHPKAFTPYSLQKVEKFLEETHKNHTYTTFH